MANKFSTNKPIQIRFDEPTLDIDAGIKITQDEPLFNNTLRNLVEKNLTQMVQAIRNTLVQGPQLEFRRTSHSLKGAASYRPSSFCDTLDTPPAQESR